jgi:hypothetical protein
LKFFLDADCESVAHERKPRVHFLRGFEMLSHFAAAGGGGFSTTQEGELGQPGNENQT